MDAETERHMAALLLEEAARLRREAELSGVSAYLAKPVVRGRPNANFLTATVRNVQQANRMAEITEMWSRRSLELELEHKRHETTRHVSRRRTSDSHDVDADVAREGGRRHREHAESSSHRGLGREKRGRAAMDSVEDEDENERRRRKRLREGSRERDGHSPEERGPRRFSEDEDYHRRHRRKMREEEAAEAENWEREPGKQRKRSRAEREQRGHVAGDSEDEVAGRGAHLTAEAGKRKRHRYGGSEDEEGEAGLGPEVGSAEEDEGLDDDGIEQFLQSRVKRGRGAIGSRVDEPGPYLPRPDGSLDKDMCQYPTSLERSQVSGPAPRGGIGNGHTKDLGDAPKETLWEKKETKKRRKRKREGSDDDIGGDSSDGESEGRGERRRRRKERAKEKKGKKRAGSRSTVSEDDVHNAGSKKKKRKRERGRKRESSESGREETGRASRRRPEEGKRRKRHRKQSGSSSEEEEGEFAEDRKRMKHHE